jgi:hypothetical protein
VARPLGDHRKKKETKLAIVEEPVASVPAVTPVVVMMIGEITGGGEMAAGAIPMSMFHDLRSAAVPAVTPAAFTVVVMIGERIGWGEMMAGAIPASVFHELRYKSRYIASQDISDLRVGQSD